MISFPIYNVIYYFRIDDDVCDKIKFLFYLSFQVGQVIQHVSLKESLAMLRPRNHGDFHTGKKFIQTNLNTTKNLVFSCKFSSKTAYLIFFYCDI